MTVRELGEKLMEKPGDMEVVLVVDGVERNILCVKDDGVVIIIEATESI